MQPGLHKSSIYATKAYTPVSRKWEQGCEHFIDKNETACYRIKFVCQIVE